MPIVDLDPQPLDSPITTPQNAFVVPGAEDMEDNPRTVTPMSLGERALGAAASVVPGGSLFYNIGRSPAFAPSMRRDNLLASVWSSESAWTDRTPETDFNPFDTIKGTKYEQYPEAFEGVFNRQHFGAVMRDIDREEDDRKTLEGLPLYQTLPASLLANLLDPTVVLPGGGFYRGAKGGFSLLKTAASVGAGAGAQSAVQEAGLQAIQQTRPLSESALNIGSSMLLGSLLGWGGAALLSRGEMDGAVRALDRQLSGMGGDAVSIIEDIKPKLIATGMDEQQASANAAIVAARYGARAERLGETAIDLYRADMAEVRGGPAGDEVIDPAARQFFQSGVPDEHDASRVSTRLPTGKRSTEDPLGPERLTIGVEAMKSDPSLFEHNVNLVRDVLPENQRGGTADETARKVVDQFKDNLRYLYSLVPENIRGRSSLWYDGGRKIVDDFSAQFGHDPKSTAAVIAATSPQKDWFQNVDLARRILDIHTNKRDAMFSPEMATTAKRIFADKKFAEDLKAIEGKRYSELEDSIEKAMWLRLYDEAHHDRSHRLVTPEGNFGDIVRTKSGAPSGTGWGSLVEIAKAIDAIEARGDIAKITPLLGERHKVRNFYNNLIAPNSKAGDVTIDTHAVAAAQLRALSGNSLEVAHNFANYPGAGLPTARASAVTGVQGTYGLYADAYRELAAELGILPRQLQSITWEAVRGLFVDTWKSQAKNVQAVDAIWQKHQKGVISADEARKQIVELAGGVNPPSWYRSVGEAHGAPRDSGNAPELSGNGVPDRTAGAMDGGTRGGVADTATGWRSGEFAEQPQVGSRIFFQPGAETPRGRITLSDNKAIIDLFKTADASTFMHEAGHLWLNELVQDASRANVPQALKDDLGTILRWLKVDKAEDIGRSQHEQWAKAFERYLAEGKAPSNALAQAFEKFKQWLTAIYKSLTDISAPLSDDVRGVMDRLLATDAEIAQRGVPQGAVAGSVGAAAVMAPSLTNTALAGRAAGAAAYATAKLNPGLRIAHSESAEARNVGFNLFEMAQYIKGNQDGFASPQAVETFRKQWDAGLGEAIRMTARGYREYRKAGGQLSRTEFQAEAGKAMRRDDQHPIPEVAKVAQTWRKEVFDPLKDAAIEAGLLKPDVAVETAVSYFSRLWNRKRLTAEEGAFKAVVQQWVADNFPRWVKGFEASAERRIDPLRREIDDLEMAKLRRGEEARAREAGGEIEVPDEADIRRAIRVVQGGAQKPKGVETLTQFVRSQGGLVEDGGELRHMGINNRSMPGLIRKEKRRIGANNKVNDGGWDSDSMARHAWENGFFPEHSERPSRNEFLEALSDDFNKRRAVVREADREAYRLTDLIERIEDDLARLGVQPTEGARFSTSDEIKGMVKRVYQAMDAEADRKIAKIKQELVERQSKIDEEREVQFKGDVNEMGRDIANEVFDTLTGRSAEGVRPEFITVKARGPLKERTFNIPDELVERWLESDIEQVGRRYTRVMSSDVEIARKFGSPDMEEAIAKVKEDYDRLRAGVTDEKRLTALAKQEKSDLTDLRAVRDLLRGNYAQADWEKNFGAIVRSANAVQYILKMGQVVLSSLTEPVRVVAAKGLTPFMRDAFAGMSNPAALKMSVKEAQLAGNVLDKVMAARLSTIADLTDFYGTRGPVEKFLDNMTNVASTWNGIRLWTDGVKMLASTMIQNKILDNVARFGSIGAKDKRYLAFLGIDESMADRIAKQFAEHGEDINGVRVAHTAEWTDDVARRSYRAALNKDLDSMVVTRGAADLPLFANTPLGKLLFQFNTFNLASHQRVLLRGLQEGHGRFLSGVIALTSMGMLQTYLTALATNSVDKLPDPKTNPAWYVMEGLDKSGFFSVPMQIANGVEKLTGMNPIKSPAKLAFDEGKQGSQKNRNRNELGLLGPTAGTIQDVGTVATIPRNLAAGEDVSKAQKNAAERLLPMNSYLGVRQFLKYFLNPPNE
jgi:hypothetical protein